MEATHMTSNFELHLFNICSAIFKFWRMTLWFVLEIVFLTWFSDKFITSYFIFYINTIIEEIYCVKWQIDLLNKQVEIILNSIQFVH